MSFVYRRPPYLVRRIEPAELAAMALLLPPAIWGELPVLGAFRGDCLEGCLTAADAPGAAGLVGAPSALPGPDRPAVEDALLQAARCFLTGRGAKFFQVLLPLEQAAVSREALLRNGFCDVTTIVVMVHRETGGPGGHAPLLSVETPSTVCFSAELLPAFQRTLLATYVGSLDVPELDGRRNVHEILAGHQGQGEFDPQWWRLLRHKGQEVGVLLANARPGAVMLELIYFGLIPEARGRGMASAALRQFLVDAAGEGVQEIRLSVDERNTPARRLYQRVGFVESAYRRLFLALP